MRCAISLASASISCMVRLVVMPENTDCGTSTPTTAQTSLTTLSSVIVSLRNLVGLRSHRHADQRLAVDVALHLVAGVALDVVADLVGGHISEFALATVLQP